MGKPIALESYFEIVNRCAENEENFTIPNSDISHAAYLIQTLFDRAQEEVCVFTGELFDGVFGTQGVKNKAIKFLRENKNHELKIAYQYNVSKDDLMQRDFLKSILAEKEIQGRIRIWDARKVFQSDGFHFTVIDRKAFRFETEHDTRHAIANFGDKESAKRLAETFDMIASKSNKVFDTVVNQH